MSDEHEHEQHEHIKLDGSMGVGGNALLTIITKDDLHGEREETYQFPFALINFSTLNTCLAYNFLRGFKIVRQEKVKEEVL
jgi:hypothetical protein